MGAATFVLGTMPYAKRGPGRAVMRWSDGGNSETFLCVSTGTGLVLVKRRNEKCDVITIKFNP